MTDNYFDEYMDMVNDFTSEVSKNDDEQTKRRAELSQQFNGQIARMDMAMSGIAGEAGEINDIWKKVKFHGVAWDEDKKTKMILELGDMYWYLMQASMALGISPIEIMERNKEKLLKRNGGRRFNQEEFIAKEERKKIS